MRRIMLVTLLVIVAVSSYSQDSTRKVHWTETDYYKKSKRQKTWAWISTGVGVTVLVGTLVMEGATYVYTAGEAKASGTTVPYIIGGACVATGVVLFVASGNNKRKAKESVAFIELEKTIVPQQNNLINRSYPAIGVRMSF
jgi:hypothetical protein